MSKGTDSLGDRMKSYYEDVYRFKLTRRTPVIIRLDMRAGHTFTRKFKRPYDLIFTHSMFQTAIKLCENIQNVKIAYVQSDEISLLLTDYNKLTTSQWFDGNIQKIVSISASIATISFNEAYTHEILLHDLTNEETQLYSSRINKMTFDSRVFNLPESEVTNYFIFRQNDATRNSIEAAGQFYFSPKQLHKVTCNQIQDKLFTEKNVNWNDYPVFFKRGACIIKEYYQINDVERSHWIIDYDTPIFTQNRDYIEKCLV